MNDQRKDLIERKVMRIRYLDSYLQEISLIAGRTINESELLSIEQTCQFINKINETEKSRLPFFEVEKSDIKNYRFRRFAEELNKYNNNNIFIWHYYTKYLGALVIPSISKVNFDFNYLNFKTDYFIAYTIDGIDSLIFDVNIDDEKISIEICLGGLNWTKVVY